jgi:uncharacterized protein (DUF1501 family)
MKNTRREFIKQSMLATAGSMLIPSFLKAFDGHRVASNGPKKVVVIQLSGGNDGLNTIVPYRNDLYYQYRPQLAIAADKVLKVSDELGFNPALKSLQGLYDSGYLGIINNVGYPNPDRSHFRSMDIWHSASNSHEYWNTGWIGRYLDTSCMNCNAGHYAIEIDDVLGLALKGEKSKGLALKDPKKLHTVLQGNLFQQLIKNEVAENNDNSSLHYLYKTLAETVSSADYIYGKSTHPHSIASYPDTDFAKRLRTIAQLIISGVETRVFYVSLSGFDTHVRQEQTHERLLVTYADAVKAFADDLDKNGQLEDVLIMTFSEFGRRVAQNASGGTDHGTANNLFLIGKSLKKKGFINETPDLKKLDEEDLIHTIDFRSVYATILEKWMKTDSNKILGQAFPLVDIL